MTTTEQTDYDTDSWEYDECQCGTLGWVNGEGKCSECETTP